MRARCHQQISLAEADAHVVVDDVDLPRHRIDVGHFANGDNSFVGFFLVGSLQNVISIQLGDDLVRLRALHAVLLVIDGRGGCDHQAEK